MTVAKKTPQRTCVTCRASADKRDLMRVVRSKDGFVRVDPSGRLAGRGAYVCRRQECFEGAADARLASALRARLSEDDIDRLRRDFEDALHERDASPQGR